MISCLLDLNHFQHPQHFFLFVCLLLNVCRGLKIRGEEVEVEEEETTTKIK